MRILFVLLLAGCSGVIGDPLTRDDSDILDPGALPEDPAEAVPACTDEVCLGVSGTARLTRTQYRHSVRQLFGDVEVAIDRLPPDHEAGPFSGNEAVLTTAVDVDLYAEMARSVAGAVLEGPREFLPCEPSDALACATELVRTLTPLAYRRPITSEEEGAYVSLLTWILEEDNFDVALSTYVETLLQSPNFLYRVELATDEPVRLSAYEVATRLSHYLFREGPDADLIAAAEDGRLDTAEGVVTEARRMVEDPRSDRAIEEFHREWLGVGHLEDVARLDEALTNDVRNRMRRETEEYARAVFRDEDGTLSTLLTGRWSMLNNPMMAYYGVDRAGEGWRRVDMPERAGILTTGAVMTAHGSETFTQPVHRGLFVRNRLLCQDLPGAPPGAIDDANETAEELPDELSERERLVVITENGPCASCHSLMNSIGYGFEAFDPIGRFRMTDSTGAIVDINGSIEGQNEFETDANGSFVGAHELVAQLAGSDDVARCMSRQWFRFATQRHESPRDERAIEGVFEAFAASGFQLREAMVAVTGTDAFLYRAPRIEE
ncbi:MAG: DUF1592 domain-containing protein [Myxococcota bacterium]